MSWGMIIGIVLILALVYILMSIFIGGGTPDDDEIAAMLKAEDERNARVQGGYRPKTSAHGDPPHGGSGVKPPPGA